MKGRVESTRSWQTLLVRAGLLGVGFVGLAQGARLWYEGGVLTHRATAILSLALYLLGFVGVLAALLARKGGTETRDLAATVLLVALIGVGGNRVARIVPAHGTDAVAFGHYAAELVLEGEDPYEHDMGPAFERYGMSERYHTLKASGGKVESLSYPALSFLVYVPYVAAGGWNLNWVHLALLVATLLILLYGPPHPMGILVSLLLFLDTQVLDLAIGGVTDIVYVPLLAAAALTWRRRPLWTAVLWGLACAVKQHPWFLAPFFAVAIWRRQGDLGGTVRSWMRFFGVAALVFLIPNLPFLVHDPGSWLLGVTTPMFQQLVLFGSGLVSLTTDLGLGLDRSFHTFLSLLVLAGVLAIYARYYERLPDALWILPSLVLWFAPRALTSYFVYWVPILGAALAERTTEILEPRSQVAAGTGHSQSRTREATPSDGPPSGGPLGAFGRILLPGTPATAFGFLSLVVVGATAAAVASRPRPPAIQVRSATTLGDLEAIGEVTLAVRNRSDRPLRPVFLATNQHGKLFFWDATGPRHLAPGQRAVYHLRAPSPEAAMERTVPFRFRVYLQPAGRFFLSPVIGPYRRARNLENRDFAIWWKGLPVRWAWAGSLELGTVRHSGHSACLEVRAGSALGEWSRAALSQRTAWPTDRITFRFRSDLALAATRWPRIVVGLEVVFPRGEVLTVIPAGQTLVPVSWQIPGLRTVFVPYEAGTWQTFHVDASEAAAAFGYSGPVRVTLRPVAARHATYDQFVSACFAWVDAERASP